MEQNRETGKVVSLTTDMDVYDYIHKLDAAILMSKIALFCQLTWLASRSHLLHCIGGTQTWRANL